MFTIQTEYAVAKALRETISTRCVAEMKKHSHLLDEGRVDEHDGFEEAIDAEYGYAQARAALTLAEDNLIDWAEDHLKNVDAVKAKMVAVVFDAARNHHYKYRLKVIDLASKLKN